MKLFLIYLSSLHPSRFINMCLEWDILWVRIAVIYGIGERVGLV